MFESSEAVRVCSGPKSLMGSVDSFECMVLRHSLWFGDLLQCIKSEDRIWQVPGSWHGGQKLCIGSLDVRKAKSHLLNPHISFRENCCCIFIWPLPGFLVGRGWVCPGLSALSWDGTSYHSPQEWIGLLLRAWLKSQWGHTHYEWRSWVLAGPLLVEFIHSTDRNLLMSPSGVLDLC